MYFYKGQKILEANYGDLNSSKKQTKSEKEFDLRTLRPFKKNRSYFGRNEGVVNWFRDFLTNTKLLWFLDKCVRKIVAKIAQSAAGEKTDKICTAKILFSLTAIAFKWDSFDKSSLVMAMVVKFIYSGKATIFFKISTLLFSYVVPVKSRVDILWPSQNIWTLVFLYVVSCGLHSPAYWTLKIIFAHLKISWISVMF